MISHQPIPAAASTRPRLRVVPGSALHRLLLGCGVLGSLLFTGTFLAAGATRAGYDPWRQPISALSLGPGGWLQSLNFIAFGVLMGCFALGLRGALAPGTGAKWAPLLQAAVAAGLIIDGIFAQDPGMGYPPGTAAVTAASTHGLLHNIGLGLAATTLSARCFVLARRFAREPRWRGWATYSIITGLLFIALLAAFGMANGTPSAPAGLFEKLATIQASIYTIALCTRLLATTARVSNPASNGTSPSYDRHATPARPPAMAVVADRDDNPRRRPHGYWRGDGHLRHRWAPEHRRAQLRRLLHHPQPGPRRDAAGIAGLARPARSGRPNDAYGPHPGPRRDHSDRDQPIRARPHRSHLRRCLPLRRRQAVRPAAMAPDDPSWSPRRPEACRPPSSRAAR